MHRDAKTHLRSLVQILVLKELSVHGPGVGRNELILSGINIVKSIL
jgi:hypothetical protein